MHARLSEFFPFLEPVTRAALPPWLTPLELTGTKPMTVIVMANKFSYRHEAIFQIQKSNSTCAQEWEGVCANLHSLPFDAGSSRDRCD